MKPNKRLYSAFVFSVLLIGLSESQPCRAQLRHRLADFENITIDSSSTTRVVYEQRLYRNPLNGLLGISTLLPVAATAELIPLYQGIPIAGYKMTPPFVTHLFSRAERAALRKSVPFGQSRYKIDFRLQPDVMVNFGYREDPFQTKTNLLLQSQFYLRRGLVLNWGVVFPIVNDLDNQPVNVRPAPVFLNQFIALNQADYLSASAGLFYNDRYGLNVQYRHTDLTKRWSFGLETGITGIYYFPKGGFNYARPRELILLADIAYRLPAHDITLQVSGGQYLYQDRGVRLDFIRQFASVDIGFYIMKTGNGSTAGFNFAIPIPPGRIGQGQRIRLRSTEEFRWEYAYTRGYAIGMRYKVGYQLDALLRQYHQAYLSHQILH